MFVVGHKYKGLFKINEEAFMVLLMFIYLRGPTYLNTSSKVTRGAVPVTEG